MPGTEEHGNFGVVVLELDGFTPYSVSGFGVCATGNTPITITDMTPHNPQHFELSAYATHEGLDLGAEKESLEDLGFDVARRIVDAPCPESMTPLALEMRRTSLDETAIADGFDISYIDSTGRSGELYLPFHVKICAPTDTSEDCE